MQERLVPPREWSEGSHDNEPEQSPVHLAGVALVDMNLAAPAVYSAAIGDIPLKTIHSAGSRPWYILGPNTRLSTEELLDKISEARQYLIHQLTIELQGLDNVQRRKVLEWLRTEQTVVGRESFSAYPVGDNSISFSLNNGHLSVRPASSLLRQMELFINDLGI